MLNIFITGTNINIGKSFITAGLAATMQSLGYSTGVYNPVQIGPSGLNFLKKVDPYIKTYSSYPLNTQVMPQTIPLIAAELEGVFIDKNVIKKDYQTYSIENDCTIVECTGGLMTPIAQSFLMADMIRTLDLPTVIVISPNLDTVNHALLTINQAKTSGINVRGVIINNYPENAQDISIRSIPRLIEEYSDAKVLGMVKHFDELNKINPNDLITNILNGIDIESVFDVTISRLRVD